MQAIEITGGGLAGLAAGIALRQLDVPVRLTEARAWPRHRLCGEFLHGSGEQMLARLGIEAPDQASRHRTAGWFDARGCVIGHRLPRPTRGLSRWWLDAALARRLEALGGEITIARAADECPQPGRVLATGRQRQPSPWFGLKSHLRDLELDYDLEMHFGTNGYLGLTRVEDGWINACGIFRSEGLPRVAAAGRLPALLAAGGLDDLAARIRAAALRPGSICGVAGLRLGRQPANDTCPATLGDARHCTAPLTGNGQSMALEAGVLAAPVLARWAVGEWPWPVTLARLEATLSRHQGHRLPLALALHHTVLHAPGRRLLAAAARRGLIPFTHLARTIT